MQFTRLVIASAWQLAALSAASAQSPTEEIPLRLTQQDITTIGAALGDRPYRDVRPLIDKLQMQINDHALKLEKERQAKPAEPSKAGE